MTLVSVDFVLITAGPSKPAGKEAEVAVRFSNVSAAQRLSERPLREEVEAVRSQARADVIAALSHLRVRLRR